jgi:hypothetical protein
MVVAATVFTMRFSFIDPSEYGSVFLSIRTLFGATVTNFTYENLGSYDRSHTIFLILHLIITTIFMV